MRFQFVNRTQELEILEREYRSNGLRLVIVYGRRRIGKTYLLNYFSKDKNRIFFIAIESSKSVLYQELSRLVSEWIGKPIGVFTDIESLSLIHI